MSVSAADSPLLHSVRQYLEQRGMEIVPASAPFAFLGRYPNNPAVTQGAFVAESIDRLSPDQMEAIATAASAAAIDRILIFADGMFPPEISRKAFQLCISLIDRSELQTVRPEPVRPNPPPASGGHHVPMAAISARPSPPPLPILTPVYPSHPKPKAKRSLGGQVGILIAAIIIGRSSLAMIADQIKENFGGNLSSLTFKAAAKPYVLPVNESSPTFESSRAEPSIAYARELYRLDEITDPGLKALADDFLAKEAARIPKVYLDAHKSAIDANWSRLEKHPGLALLIAELHPNRAVRIQLYDWLIPKLKELGDVRLIYLAASQKAVLTKKPEDIAAGISSLGVLLNHPETTTERIEFHFQDIISSHGRYLYDSAPREIVEAVESCETVPLWFKKLLRARYHLEAGWDARGTGYADTVSAGQWKVFDRELALAKKAFEEAWELHPHPYISAELITIAKNDQDDRETRLWFEKTLSVRADYDLAYRNYLGSLMPRWGGSNEETKAFGKACLHPALQATDVPFHLLTAHINRSIESGNKMTYWRMLPEDEKLEILEMIDTQLASRPHPASQRYYLSLKTALLYLLVRYEETATVLGQVGNDLDSGAFSGLPLTEDEIITTLVVNRIPVHFVKENQKLSK